MADQAFPVSQDIKLKECNFDAMKLQISERLELELIDQPDHKLYFSRLIGYLHGRGLIVQTPMVNGLPIPMRDAERILVRVFSGTQAFAFTCTVARICISPFHYLHLTFPAVVHGAVIRQTLRVKANLVASVIEAAHATCPLPAESTLINLSIAGALLAAPNGLGIKGNKIKLRFNFFVDPDNKPVDMECSAVIKSIKEEKVQTQYGIAFQELAWSESLLLQNLVYKTLLENYRNVA